MRRAALAVSLGVLFAGGARAESTPLQLVAPTWPPYADRVGEDRIAVELVQTALRRAGIDAEIVVRDEPSVLHLVESGSFAGSVALWKTEGRAKTLSFSKPYLENRLVLVARAGTDASARSLASLEAGARVGLVKGYAYGAEVEAAKGPTFVRHEGAAVSLRALLSGELDYVLADSLLVHHLFQAQPARAEALLAVASEPVAIRTLHLALRDDVPRGRELLDRFDAAIRAMLKDGTFNRVLGVDWVRADVDGDGRPELVAAERAGRAAPSRSYAALGSSSLPGDDRVYVIDGVRYAGWEAVPDRHKKPTQWKTKQSQVGVVLMKF